MSSNRMCSRMTMLAATAVLCCAPAFAQNTTPRPMPGSSNANGSMQNGSNPQNGGMNGNMAGMQGDQMGGMNGASAQDKMFLKKAAGGGMAEVQLGQLALQKSSNDQVKQFAQKMVDDHGKMNDQIKPIAQGLKVDLPSQPMAKEQATITKLQGMSGADFDKAYMKDMVKDHEEDLKDFKKEASTGKDPQVKDAAQQGSTVISEHLKMAKDVASSVGAMGSMGKMNPMGHGKQNTTAGTAPQGGPRSQ